MKNILELISLIIIFGLSVFSDNTLEWLKIGLLLGVLYTLNDIYGKIK